MTQYQSKDLFQVQIELVDTKVENAANKAIDRVIERIDALKSEIHELKIEMNIRFASVENRLTALETKLGMRNEIQSELRNRTIEYAFKGGWLILATVVSAVLLYFHINH